MTSKGQAGLAIKVKKYTTILAFAIVCLGFYMIQLKSTGQAAAQPRKGLVEIDLPQTLSAQAQAGKAIFSKNCSQCHGPNGIGQEGLGPPLVHKIYEPSHHGDMSFYRAAALGVPAHHWRFGNMPSVPDVTEADITLIINYIRTLQRYNGIF